MACYPSPQWFHYINIAICCFKLHLRFSLSNDERRFDRNNPHLLSYILESKSYEKSNYGGRSRTYWCHDCRSFEHGFQRLIQWRSQSSKFYFIKGLQIVGYLLIILSLFTNGFLFVFEQKLLSKYHLEPLQVVGYEGMYGLIIEIILLPILTFVPCSFGVEPCVFNSAGMPFLERPERYFA